MTESKAQNAITPSGDSQVPQEDCGCSKPRDRTKTVLLSNTSSFASEPASQAGTDAITFKGDPTPGEEFDNWVTAQRAAITQRMLPGPTDLFRT